jgi:hypothetical protein
VHHNDLLLIVFVFLLRLCLYLKRHLLYFPSFLTSPDQIDALAAEEEAIDARAAAAKAAAKKTAAKAKGNKHIANMSGVNYDDTDGDIISAGNGLSTLPLSKQMQAAARAVATEHSVVAGTLQGMHVRFNAVCF